MAEIRVIQGDCLALLPTLDACSIDAVVTDPPYHLTSIGRSLQLTKNGDGTDRTDQRNYTERGFMGKTWDGGDVAFRPETWAEVLRVMKPGGHMVAFGGTRTAHRLCVAIEDAGFEIRDSLMWVYGSGFPKSHDVSKAIDARMLYGGSHSKDMKRANGDRPGDGRVRASTLNNGIMGEDAGEKITRDIPATPEGAAWQGWGTALKPAHEPIILARKPFTGSVAANVLACGCGGLNIDACRIGETKCVPGSLSTTPNRVYGAGLGGHRQDGSEGGHDPNIGRWPANVLHDGSDEVMGAFAAFGESKSTDRPRHNRTGDTENWRMARQDHTSFGHSDSGSAARFFYCAKADTDDRAGSKHPTVKPLSLLSWLVRLITPPGGTILDPFAGSGTTGEAAMINGFDCVLIEREAQHAADIRHRIKRWSGLDTPLFAEAV